MSWFYQIKSWIELNGSDKSRKIDKFNAPRYYASTILC
jgi:hypothetical protein